MLVLSRKRGERVRIGQVVVTVLRTAAGAVRLGIEGPRDVQVVRTELDGIRPTGPPRVA